MVNKIDNKDKDGNKVIPLAYCIFQVLLALNLEI